LVTVLNFRFKHHLGLISADGNLWHTQWTFR